MAESFDIVVGVDMLADGNCELGTDSVSTRYRRSPRIPTVCELGTDSVPTRYRLGIANHRVYQPFVSSVPGTPFGVLKI